MPSGLTPNDLLEAPLTTKERELMAQWIREKRARDRAAATSADELSCSDDNEEEQHTAMQHHFTGLPAPGARPKQRSTVPSSLDVGAKRGGGFARDAAAGASRFQVPSVLAPLRAAAPAPAEAVRDDWTSARLDASKPFESVQPPSAEWSSERPGSFAPRPTLMWNASRESLGTYSEVRTASDAEPEEDESPFAFSASNDSAWQGEHKLLPRLTELEAPRKRSVTLPTFNVTPATAELEGSFDSSENAESPVASKHIQIIDPALARFVNAWSAHEKPAQHKLRAVSQSPGLSSRRATPPEDEDQLMH